MHLALPFNLITKEFVIAIFWFKLAEHNFICGHRTRETLAYFETFVVLPDEICIFLLKNVS